MWTSHGTHVNEFCQRVKEPRRICEEGLCIRMRRMTHSYLCRERDEYVM